MSPSLSLAAHPQLGRASIHRACLSPPLSLIAPSPALSLSLTAGRCFQIFVTPLSGPQIILDVDSSTTVAHVKDLLHDSEGVQPAQQHLVLGGRELKDPTKTLADYGVTSDSTISLRLWGKGGAVVIVVTLVGPARLWAFCCLLCSPFSLASHP
jgi:hypothetical protein